MKDETSFSMKSFALFDNSITIEDAGMIVLDAYSRASNGC